MTFCVSSGVSKDRPGGDCSQSFNVQENSGSFLCSDLGEGVPTKKGEKAFILVTDTDGDTVFHKDWINVGSFFTLSHVRNNFPTDHLITIYNSTDTDNINNRLQVVKYNASCTNNVFLKDRFGAVQLVSWVNEDQGKVSCFANQTFTLDSTAPVDIQGGPAMLESLIVASNVQPFFFNLTEKVHGTVVHAGDTVQSVISIPIDLTQKRMYNLLMTMSAVTEAGQKCNATALTSFSAGYPLPSVFPTYSPTKAASASSSPVPDV